MITIDKSLLSPDLIQRLDYLLASEAHTQMADAEELIKKGEDKKEIEMVLEMYAAEMTIKQITRIAKKTEQQISEITAQYRK